MKLSLIVCPVDFSPSGHAALGPALALARWHEAELHVLHVPSGRARRNASGTATAGDPVLERLVKLISSADSEGVAVTPVILSGDPVRAVAEYARLKSADLVVVGQHGRRGSRLWSSGTLATEMARAVASPTLAVSKETEAGTGVASFSNILCAVDFSAPSLRALSHALMLAQRSGGRLTLLHVLDGFPYESVYSGSRAFRLVAEYRTRVDEVKRELRALVPADALNWCEVETEVVSGIAHDAIVATANARGADLVVIGRARRTRLDGIVMASTLSGVLRRAGCPVLAVPGPSEVNHVASKAASRVRDDKAPVAPWTIPANHGVRPTDAGRNMEVL